MWPGHFGSQALEERGVRATFRSDGPELSHPRRFALRIQSGEARKVFLRDVVNLVLATGIKVAPS